ncbi:MAG: CPBP family intramembrane metalloprotease [Acidobacteria bacterium]|nr:CPBP family intramembrane metalloprotease [Acidobacteriota bacterium]
MEPETSSPSGASAPGPASAWSRVAGTLRQQPGWGVLLFILLGALATLLIVAPIDGVLRRYHAPAYLAIPLGELALAVAVVLVTAIMAGAEQRPFWSFGLERRAAARRFGEGALWGILSLTVLLGAMRAGGHFYFGALDESPVAAVRFGLLWLAMFLLVGIFEELTFRGYLQFTLSRGLGFWPTAIILSALFGLSHRGNSGETSYGVFAAGLFGLFICLTLKRTGSLWWAIGFHMAWDYAESFLYSVPDSGTVIPGHLLSSHFTGASWITGGSAGPEGSLFIFPLLGVMALLFALVYREPAKPQPAPEPVPEPAAANSPPLWP